MKGRGYRKGDGGQVYYGYWKTEKRRPISIGLDWQVVCGQTGAGRVPKPESIQVVYDSFTKFRLNHVRMNQNISIHLAHKNYNSLKSSFLLNVAGCTRNFSRPSHVLNQSVQAGNVIV